MTSSAFFHRCHAVSVHRKYCEKQGLHQLPASSSDVWFCLGHLNYELSDRHPVRSCVLGKDVEGWHIQCSAPATHPLDYSQGEWACEDYYTRAWLPTVPQRKENYKKMLMVKENVENGKKWMEKMAQEHGWVLYPKVADGWNTWCVKLWPDSCSPEAVEQ